MDKNTIKLKLRKPRVLGNLIYAKYLVLIYAK